MRRLVLVAVALVGCARAERVPPVDVEPNVELPRVWFDRSDPLPDDAVRVWIERHAIWVAAGRRQEPVEVTGPIERVFVTLRLSAETGPFRLVLYADKKARMSTVGGVLGAARRSGLRRVTYVGAGEALDGPPHRSDCG